MKLLHSVILLSLPSSAVDHAWFAAVPSTGSGQVPWQVDHSNCVLKFLVSQDICSYPDEFTLDGEPLSGDHSTGLVTMAADPEIGKHFVQELWDAQISSGKLRSYDGMLYMLAILHASLNFKIYIHG
jgi:oligosaccharide reducing-end xylanase